MSFLKSWIDPDRNWKSLPTFQHFLAGFGLLVLFHDFGGYPMGTAIFGMLWSALIWEIAQADVTHDLPAPDGAPYGGRPGYGFGPLDIGASCLGGLLYLGVRLVLKW